MTTQIHPPLFNGNGMSAIIDWLSRYILAWDLSIGMEAEFCAGVLEDALKI